ncbi:MAG: patatin-like phospholipase family protein [Crocinitomicaceae bacterium]|nr:patatin-like phospholipase family protein [Crocinitomicaceae bacterium]
MNDKPRKLNFIDVIQAFFPFQLLIAQLKYNVFSLLFWGTLFLIANDSLGYSFGIPLLFLSPEYLGTVSPWSFFLLGFALGGFTMGFNTYSYIKIGPRFPFLATISKPFFRFCINNGLIPAIFMIFLMVRVVDFQIYEEFVSVGPVIVYLLSLLAGFAIFMTLSFFFFFRISRKKNKNHEEHGQKPISSLIHRPEKWYERFKTQKDRTSIYFGKLLKLNVSRSSKHFDKELIERVFGRNKINSSIFELITISIFFFLGAFSSYEAFEVPAAVSIVLLMTIFLMLFSALHSWFKGWVYPLLIMVFVLMNYLSVKTDSFNYTNYAYGLNYNLEENDEYSIPRIRELSTNDSLYTSSKYAYIETLENWQKSTQEEKPKLIIINTSGGGSRSALWTMVVLQNVDAHLDGKLASHTQLITGASGGMVGAAYYRELQLRELRGEINDANDEEYRKNISKDMLNKLSFMASTNDIFFRYQTYEYNNQSYTRDRGCAFEEQLHQNTGGILDHNLGYYTNYEQSGAIPTMIFSPTIVNDGRRLLISSQHIDFLTYQENHGTWTNANENLEYHSLLQSQDTDSIRFSSVLRSSATFPFVMPMVTLPTSPEIQLMDAGIRDNYGGKTMVQFLFEMQDWIKENTSGVIILQIRDTQKVLDNETYREVSFFDKITLPFGNMYKNFPRVQDFNQEELLSISAASFSFPVDLITFNLRERQEDRISLSWHLTKQEKQKIETAFKSRKNQRALAQLERLL